MGLGAEGYELVKMEDWTCLCWEKEGEFEAKLKYNKGKDYNDFNYPLIIIYSLVNNILIDYKRF